MKRLVVSIICLIAVCMDISCSVIAVWHYDGFDWINYMPLLIAWIISKIFLLLFIYANTAGEICNDNNNDKMFSKERNKFVLVDLKKNNTDSNNE